MSAAQFYEGAVAFSTPIPLLCSQKFEISSPKDEKIGRVWHNVMHNSCIPALMSGIAGSLATKHPFPLFAGLSACFPRALAQQKVGGEFQVNTYTIGNQFNPSASSLSNGGFVVAWVDDSGEDGSSYGVFGQIFNATGAKVSGEFLVNTYTTGIQANPSVSSLSNGGFVIAWEDDNGLDGNGAGVFAQIFNATGAKVGGEFQVNTFTIGGQGGPSVSSLINGDFVVAWTDTYGEDGFGYGVFGQRFSATGAKAGSEFQVNTYTIGSQVSPSVSSLSNGDFVIAWIDDGGLDGNSYGIFAQVFNATGGKIGNQFLVNTHTLGGQMYPSASSLRNGHFVIGWEDESGEDGNSYGVFAQIFNATGGKVGSEFQVNTYTTGMQGGPSVSTLSNGNFVIAWYDGSGEDGNSYGVFSQIFNATGGKVGSEFQVNTYTPGMQYQPSASALSNGDFVIAWRDASGHDGNNSGVFGQIFNPNAVPSSSTAAFPLTTGLIAKGTSTSSGSVGTTVSTTTLSGTTMSSSSTTTSQLASSSVSTTTLSGTTISSSTTTTSRLSSSTASPTTFAGTTISSSSTTISQSASNTGGVVVSSSAESNTISWLVPAIGVVGGAFVYA